MRAAAEREIVNLTMKRSVLLTLVVAVAAGAAGAWALGVFGHDLELARPPEPVSVRAGATATKLITEPPKSAVDASSATSEHAVILHLRLSAKGFGVKHDVVLCQQIEEALEQEIARADVGEMDGNEIGDGECILFMYGPDADKLFGTVAPRARSSRLGKGGWAIKRYGSPDDPQAREVRVDL